MDDLIMLNNQDLAKALSSTDNITEHDVRVESFSASMKNINDNFRKYQWWHILSICENSPRFLTLECMDQCDIAAKIENSCYDSVFKFAKTNDIEIGWKSYKFKYEYELRLRRILMNLDPTSSVNVRAEDPDNLMNRLLSGEIEIASLADMSSIDMNPDLSG
jgi:hypothetical protein